MLANDYRSLLVTLQMFYFFSDQFSFFKIQIRGMLNHFPFIMLYDRLQVAFQDITHLLQCLCMLLLGLLPFAGPFTIAEMIFETYLVFTFLYICRGKI